MKENTQKLNVQGFATRNKNIFFFKKLLLVFPGTFNFQTDMSDSHWYK